MVIHSSQPDYRKVAEELDRNGAKTLLQKEHQLVVATALPTFPDSSNSFWLTFHCRHWHVVTWAPRVYRIPESANVVEVSMACLKASTKAAASLPEELVVRLNLKMLNDKEAEQIVG
jgi:hypothetical protein